MKFKLKYPWIKFLSESAVSIPTDIIYNCFHFATAQLSSCDRLWATRLLLCSLRKSFLTPETYLDSLPGARCSAIHAKLEGF
jgi:hypothetical protein